MLKKSNLVFDFIGCLLGWCIVAIAWIITTMLPAHAKASLLVEPVLPTLSLSMFLATIIGSVGGYLAFGEDKKFPPSTTSIGHVLLGFGAGLFFTRGSLELMGRLNSSEDMIMLVSFLWAVGGYFVLRLAIAVINSERIKEILPDWVARLLGLDKDDNKGDDK